MSLTKDTNPKDSLGIRKVPVSTLSARVIGEVGLAMLEGARKYGRHNYRVAGVRASVYYDACVGRHLAAWWEGEDLDKESGLSHITKAIACLFVLRDSMLVGNWVDDRPPALQSGWVEDLNTQAGEIIDRIPDGKLPFTQLDMKVPASYSFSTGINASLNYVLIKDFPRWPHIYTGKAIFRLVRELGVLAFCRQFRVITDEEFRLVKEPVYVTE